MNKYRPKWTDVHTELLINNKNLSNRQLAELLGVHEATVSRYRKVHNARRGDGYRRKYIERSEFNDFTLGWCLGLFATDGALVTNRRNRSPVERISLTLTRDDYPTVLNFFNSLIQEPEIKEADLSVISPSKDSYAKEEKVRFLATLPTFTLTVRKYLSFTKKTYDLKLTDCFYDESDEFKLGFLRGCIDGDGHVSLAENGLSSISLVSASKEFIEGLQKEFGGVVSKRKSGNYWDLRFRKQEVSSLVKRGILYDTELPMKRKTDRLVDGTEFIK